MCQIIVISTMSAGCAEFSYTTIRGQTMGTYFAIQYDARDCRIAQSDVEERLGELNQSLSTYLPSSEISRFNTAPAQTTYLFRSVICKRSVLDAEFI